MSNPPNPFATKPRLASALRHYRRQSGLSQEDLARHSRIDASTISFIESGRSPRPWTQTLDALAVVIADYTPHTTKDQILTHLLEARDNKTPEHVVPYQLRPLVDRLTTYHPAMLALAIEAIDAMLDLLEKAEEYGRRR